MEHTLISVYLTHLLLQLQLAELDYREAEKKDLATRDGRDIVVQRSEQVLKCLQLAMPSGKIPRFSCPASLPPKHLRTCLPEKL